jgi:hypothetical protein
MSDPLLQSAKYVLKESLNDLATSVDGLPAEALNWKPGGDDTNTITVLVTHVLHSTRSWLCVAVGATLPQRDRDSEFRVRAGDPRELGGFLKDFSGQCRDVLENAKDLDWSLTRKTHARPGNAPEEVPATFALIHAIEHLREHVAHIALTRQLWEARVTSNVRE